MLDAHQLLWTQIAAGVCLLIFGGLLFNLFRMRGGMRAASTWSKVEGVIIASMVQQPPSGLIAAVLVAHAIAGRVLYTGNGVPLFAFALPAVAILVAVFSVVSFARGRRLASASARWPTVSGTITSHP
jgi:hypothetical protein